MTVQISSLRVQAEMDASAYEAGARRKVAADQQMVTAGKALDSQVTATNRTLGESATAITRLQRSIDPAFKSNEAFERGVRTLNAALDRGRISAERHAALLKMLEDRYRNAGGASANFNRSLGVTSAQLQQLTPQFNDIFVQLASGTSIFTTLVQQGPQITQIFGGLGNTLRAIPPGLIAVAAPLAAIGAAFAAYEGYSASVRALDQANRLMGQGMRVSAGDVAAFADAGGLSVAATRGMIAELTRMGQIAPAVMGELIAVTRDYAAVTGQDAAEATRELGRLMRDPAKGAEELARQYNLLSGAQLAHIQRLAETGQRTEAQSRLTDALASRIRGAAAETSVWARAWTALGNAASDSFLAIGGAIDRAVNGAGLDQRIAELEALLKNGAYANNPGGRANVERQLQDVLLQRAERDRRDRSRSQTANDNAASVTADEIARAYNQTAAAIRTTEAEIAKLQKGLGTGLMAEAERAKAALAGLQDRLTFLTEAQSKGLDAATYKTVLLAEAERKAAGMGGQQRERWLAGERARIELLDSALPLAERQARISAAVTSATAAQAQSSADAARELQLQTAAQERLAAAAGQGEAAMRRARIENEVAAAAARGLGDATRAALEAQEQSERRAVRADQTQPLLEQIRAQERLTEAIRQGPAAARDAELAAQAHALALREVERSSADFNATYEHYLALLRQGARADTGGMIAQLDAQLKTKRRQLDAEAALVGQSADRQATGRARNEALESLRAQGLEYDKLDEQQRRQVDTLLEAAEANALLQGEIKRQSDAWSTVTDSLEKGFERVGDSIIDAIVKGEGGALDLKNAFKGVIASIAADFAKLAVVNPLKNMMFGGKAPTIFDLFGGAGGTPADANGPGGAGKGAITAAQSGMSGWANTKFSGVGALSSAVGGFTTGFAVGGMMKPGNKVGGALAGAASGALAGAAAGPWGALIGGIAGAIGGLLGAGSKPSDFGTGGTVDVRTGARTIHTGEANSETAAARERIFDGIDKIAAALRNVGGYWSQALNVNFKVGSRDPLTYDVGGTKGQVAKGDADALLSAITREMGKRAQGLGEDVAFVLAHSTTGKLEDLLKELDFADGFKDSLKALAEAADLTATAMREGTQRAREHALALRDFLGQTAKTFKSGTGAGQLLPAYASGTRSAASGYAIVGEQGPELVVMAGGEQVLDARKTAETLSRLGEGRDDTIVHLRSTDELATLRRMWGGRINPLTGKWGFDNDNNDGNTADSTSTADTSTTDTGSPGSTSGGMSGNPGSENAAHGTAHSSTDARDSAYGGSYSTGSYSGEAAIAGNVSAVTPGVLDGFLDDVHTTIREALGLTPQEYSQLAAMVSVAGAVPSAIAAATYGMTYAAGYAISSITGTPMTVEHNYGPGAYGADGAHSIAGGGERLSEMFRDAQAKGTLAQLVNGLGGQQLLAGVSLDRVAEGTYLGLRATEEISKALDSLDALSKGMTDAGVAIPEVIVQATTAVERELTARGASTVSVIDQAAIAQTQLRDQLTARGVSEQDYGRILTLSGKAANGEVIDPRGIADVGATIAVIDKVRQALTDLGRAVPDSLTSLTRQLQALDAARKAIDAEVAGTVIEPSDVQKKIADAQGYWAGMAQAMEAVGWTGDVAAAKQATGLDNTMKKLRADWTKTADQQINEVTGRGYLNQISTLYDGLKTNLADTAALGLPAERAHELWNQGMGQVLASLTESQLAEVSVKFGLSLDQLRQIMAKSTVTSEALQASVKQAQTAILQERLAQLDQEAQRIEALKDQYGELAKSLKNARLSLLLDGELSTLDPRARLEEARRQVEATAARARGGDVGAMGELEGLGRAFLEASRGFNASNTDYAADFDWIQRILADTETVAERQAKLQGDTLAELQRQTNLMQAQIQAANRAQTPWATMEAQTRSIVGNSSFSTGIDNLGRSYAEQQGTSGLSRGEYQAIARLSGYTGDFGKGGHNAALAADPELAKIFNQLYGLAVTLAPKGRFATGGVVPHAPGTMGGVDSYHALLTPGEGVLTTRAMGALGRDGLASLNAGALPSNVLPFRGPGAGAGAGGADGALLAAIERQNRLLAEQVQLLRASMASNASGHMAVRDAVAAGNAVAADAAAAARRQAAAPRKAA